MVGMVVVVECSLVGMFVGRNGRCGRMLVVVGVVVVVECSLW